MSTTTTTAAGVRRGRRTPSADPPGSDGPRGPREAAGLGITNFVQVSALGASDQSASAYARTKAQAEAAVREHAGFVVLPDDEARALAGDVDGNPVHQAQLRRAAADGDASHAHAHAGCIHGLDVDGVGVVGLGEGVAHELKLEAL